jgi:L-malate glycosyltransferase
MTSSPSRARPVPVLEFLTSFNIGGTERQVLDFVRGVDADRFAVHVGCFRSGGELRGEIDPLRTPVTEYGIASLPSLRTLWQQGRLTRYVRRHRLRIVHSYGYYANVFAVPAGRLAGAAVVASVRETGEHLTPRQRKVQKWICGRADHVLVNAEAVRRVLLDQGCDAARVSVIRNGVDLSRFRARGPSSALRGSLGLPASAPLVTMVARLHPLKGIECFLEAAALLARRFTDARFLVVGDAVPVTYRHRLQAAAAERGLGDRVVFAGFRGDVPQLLAETCVFALPSLSEGLSNAVLEAMAAAVPVVATSVGGTPEVVEDGVTGLLVALRDASALAHAVGSLLADPIRARAMGEAGRRRIEDHFSLAAMVGETERLYARLLSVAAERGTAPLLAGPAEDGGP